MKKMFIIVLFGLLVQAAIAQSPNSNGLPASISTVFFKVNPGAKIKKWRLSNSIYEVKYRSANKSHTAFFSADGKWLKDETRFAFTHSLPAAVKNGLAANGFASFYFERITEVDSTGEHHFNLLADSYPPSPDEDSYFFKQYDLSFSGNGVLTKKVLLPFQ